MIKLLAREKARVHSTLRHRKFASLIYPQVKEGIKIATAGFLGRVLKITRAGKSISMSLEVHLQELKENPIAQLSPERVEE
jgi:hypothetical protein